MTLTIDTPGPARVIVSDDQSAVCADVCDILTREGFEIALSTSDSEEARRAIAQSGAELAVLGMSEATGFGDAWSANDEIVRNTVALVALTGGTDGNVIADARDAGAAALLRKPVVAAEFAPAVHIALARFIQSTDGPDRNANR